MIRIISGILALVSFSSMAGEIEVSTANVTCIGKGPGGIYEYRIGLILKNISDQELTLISKSQGGSVHYDDPNVPTVLIGNASELKINGVLVVPVTSDLGLVTIQPGEGAQVYENYKTKSALGQKARVGYHAASMYGGRFNNWHGVVTSGEEQVANHEACQP